MRKRKERWTEKKKNKIKTEDLKSVEGLKEKKKSTTNRANIKQRFLLNSIGRDQIVRNNGVSRTSALATLTTC